MRGLLVFGQNGQVAKELHRLAPDAEYLGRDRADLVSSEQCAEAIALFRPRIVINAAAYTAVDRAEEETDIARQVNALAPGAMASEAARQGVPFLHVSTDYVFDGSGDAARTEDEATGPLGAYGATKLQGEQAIAAAGGQWAVMRTSWVFSAHGTNFVRTMLRLAGQRDELGIVSDQIGGPTPAADIAQSLLLMAEGMLADQRKGGTYHFAGGPDVSWADFAREIFGQSGLDCHVRDIATTEYPTPAQRPLNSRLDCRRIRQDFGIERPDWRKGLSAVLKELEDTA